MKTEQEQIEAMTQDEIKKELERAARLTGKDVFVDAYKIITEQEQEIELLKMQLQDVVNHADTFLAEEQKFEAENVKLKAKIEDLKDEIIYLERKIAIRDNALKDRDKAIEMLEGKQDTIVKQAQIDVLERVQSECAGVYPEYIPEIIDELIKEVENDEDKG